MGIFLSQAQLVKEVLEDVGTEHQREDEAPAAMHETVSEHLPPFPAMPYVIRTELQGIEVQRTIEAQEAHNDRYGYDDKGYHECKDTDYLENGSRVQCSPAESEQI